MKTYFHIDVNSAYLSWEAAFRLQCGEDVDLRKIPSVVGGDIKSRRGIILAKSIPAKKYGIVTGESLTSALKKCPGLTVVKSNFDLYIKSSKALFELIGSYSENLIVYSIDECFLDVSDLSLLCDDFTELAYRLKEDIKETLGFTVSIGISSNMILAKMASDLKKPDAISTIYSHEIEEKLWPLPIGNLFMIGRNTEKKLLNLGMRTIGDFAKTDPHVIRRYLKTPGLIAWNYANGIEVQNIANQGESVKSIGNSTTIRFDVDLLSEALTILLSLTEKVMERLRGEEMLAKTVCVSYKSSNFEVFEHQGTFYSPTDHTMEVFEKISELFKELWDGRSIRALGVRVCNPVKAEGLQLNFFDKFYLQKSRHFDSKLDDMRKQNKILRARLLNSGLEDVVSERREELEDFLFLS